VYFIILILTLTARWRVLQGGGIFLEYTDRGKTLRLSVRSLSPDDAGTYTCKAKNRLGHDEQSSTVTVQCTSPFIRRLLFVY